MLVLTVAATVGCLVATIILSLAGADPDCSEAERRAFRKACWLFAVLTVLGFVVMLHVR